MMVTSAFGLPFCGSDAGAKPVPAGAAPTVSGATDAGAVGADGAENRPAKNAAVVAANLGYPASNVEFRKGMADAMPVEDGTINLIISNCVINLAPDKRKVFREMFRVAKPGGRFTISDIVADQTVPQYLVHDAEKWGDCLSGALTLTAYIAGMTDAGFLGIHLVKSSP